MAPTQQRTDDELKNAVVDELTWTASVNATHVGVAVNRGAVTLSGEVDSYPEKLLAEEAALRVRGVTAIAEEITVRRATGADNDTDLARDAGEALVRAVDVPAGLVKAAVHDHVITLSGTVQWHYQREAAARAVRYLRGVAGVSNAVTIRADTSPEDIRSAISAALVRTAQSEGAQMTVTADAGGAVTLAGPVHSWLEHRQAEHAAWSAPGVTAVDNQLRIES